jgi:DNA-directed RNA polymerase subunit RPC12/RpoP
VKTVASFVIVVCSRCGGLLAAKAEQKTRTCPYCGFKIVLYKSKHVAVADNAREASAILKMLKMKAAEKRKASCHHHYSLS